LTKPSGALYSVFMNSDLNPEKISKYGYIQSLNVRRPEDPCIAFNGCGRSFVIPTRQAELLNVSIEAMLPARIVQLLHEHHYLPVFDPDVEDRPLLKVTPMIEIGSEEYRDLIKEERRDAGKKAVEKYKRKIAEDNTVEKLLKRILEIQNEQRRTQTYKRSRRSGTEEGRIQKSGGERERKIA